MLGDRKPVPPPYCRWKSNYQEGRVRIPLTGLASLFFVHIPNQVLEINLSSGRVAIPISGLTPPYICAYPKSFIMVFVLFNDLS
jgi:hypothetical protein